MALLVRFCPSCRTPNQAIKKLDICKLPDVLIIHLKRFQYSGMYRDKLHQLVQFPMQLDFTKFLNKGTNDEDSQYQLFAVSVFSDSELCLTNNRTTWVALNQVTT